MPRLEAGVHQPPPDCRKLLHPGAEKVDALPAGDLRVEAEVPGDLAEHDELLRGDLAAGDARHDRVGAVALDVGQEVIVGVLQCRLLTVEDVPVLQAGQDRGDCRLADVAAPAAAVPGISSVNVLIPLAATIPNSSARVWLKCSHSAVLTATPLSASSVFSSGTQEPQPVPALVAALMPATSVSPWPVIAVQIASLVTAWQEQTWASPGRARSLPRCPPRAPPPAGAIIVTGSPGSGRPTSGRSAAYLDASPTSTPPSSVFASSETTSLA